MPNPQVLSSLPEAERGTDLYAQLVDLEGQQAYAFLYNPEQKQYRRSANYAEVPTGATPIPDQNYLYTSGRTLALSDLLLESYCAGVSLRPLIEELEALLIADENTLKPKPVLFIWGSERFGPAVLTSLSWEETKWLGGEPAEARVSMTLQQLPSQETPTPTPNATDETNLTERQREDARDQAGSWLNQNLSRLRPQVREAVQSSRFRYLTDTAGNVTITNSDGEAFGAAGVWDGFEFAPADDLLN